MVTARIAVLGLGSIGMRHARNALAAGLAVAGFDPDPARRALLESEGGRGVDSADAALDGAFAAVVASPNALHQADLRRCVAAGVHALVEKPLSHTVEGMAEVLDQAEAAGLTVAACFNLRFRAVVREVRTLLDQERIGRPIWGRFLSGAWLPEWRPHQDYRQGYTNDPCTGGVIFDNIHELDLAGHLLGSGRVVAASAGNSNVLGLASEDMADIVVRHDGGAQSAIHLDYVTRPRRRRFEICGTAGMLAVDLRNGTLEVRDHDDAVVMQEVHHVGFDREYQLELADFIDAARTGRKPACDGREALAVLSQAIAARRLSGLPE